MRIELTRVGLLFYLANHYTTRGALRIESVLEPAGNNLVKDGQEQMHSNGLHMAFIWVLRILLRFGCLQVK